MTVDPVPHGIRAAGNRVARLGDGETRIDGPAKVSGEACFASDVSLPDMAHAALVTSPAAGTITAIHAGPALACPGVLTILTHQNVGEAIRDVPHAMAGGWVNSGWRPLASPRVRYAGQIVAMVVATSLEAAQAAAGALRIDYRYDDAPVASLDDARSAPRPLADIDKAHHDRAEGDIDAAFADAAAQVDAHYATPVQHHNPMELPATTCHWQDGRLTVYETTRFVGAVQHGLAAQLGIPADHVRVVAPFIGGHFGAKLALSQHTALCALAARRLDRPVSLVVGRRDQFTVANHRTETRHRVRLAADRDGRLRGVRHEAASATSRFDDFAMEGADVSTALYGAGAVMSQERLGRVDRNTPGPMRAPPEVPFLFAMESAMDELACDLDIDPVELRRRNDTAADPVTGKRFTTHPLMRCFDAAAQAFDWSRRRPTPRGEQQDGWWIGRGCASAARPVKIGPAAMRLAQDAAGNVRVECAHLEIGNGLYTLLAAIASERLDVPLGRVTVVLGDSALPPTSLSGGSSTTTSLANALATACDALRRQPDRPREVRIDYVPPGLDAKALDKIAHGHVAMAPAPPDKLGWSFGAHMVEVHVHAATGEVRVPRHVAAFAAGRILNPLAARSQYLGGMLWGQSAALLEETVIDPRSAAYVNRDLADYLVPTAADVGSLEAIMVPDDDPDVNPEGVKGLGEIGIIGVNAAIANAVFNATGVRVRDLPIRVEHLL